MKETGLVVFVWKNAHRPMQNYIYKDHYDFFTEEEGLKECEYWRGFGFYAALVEKERRKCEYCGRTLSALTCCVADTCDDCLVDIAAEENASYHSYEW